MTTEYLVKLKLTLVPVQQPWIMIKVGEHQVTQQLTVQTDFEFEFTAKDQAVLTVEHYGKSDQDAVTAVVIQRIEFYGIYDPRFIWAGTYYPVYPDHYPDQKFKLPGQGYLSWNGTYILDFQVPVFSWIHQVQDLGWLYQ
jgi:hypothetical protein